MSETKDPIMKNGDKMPSKPLPVTLLSGFLGSGKTTLLTHILSSQHGLRIAVIVNDIGAINVDASLIRSSQALSHTSEKMIALQNGCICCTLRGDLLEELVRLAEIQAFDYVIIESSGISEPEQVAETFDRKLVDVLGTAEGQGLSEGMMKAVRKVRETGGLEHFAKLDTTVTVVDAFTLFHDFETSELLSNRRDDVVPEDERTVSDLMVDQIEFAEVIILNKIDLVDLETRDRIMSLIPKLNHRAKIIQARYGRIDVKRILNTGSFSLEAAQTGYGWLQDLHAMTVRELNGKYTMTPKPETEEYNVQNFVYSRRRPFHPFRLFELIHDKFILQQQYSDEDASEMDVDNDEPESEDDEKDDDFEMISDQDSESDNTSLSEKSAANITNAETIKTKSSKPEASKTKPTTLQTPSPQTILSNKRSNPLFRRLFRSKGEFWLATRPQLAGDWSQAGAVLTLQAGRTWFCCQPESDWKSGDAEIDAIIQHDMDSKWGDRRQELVFIGEGLDERGIEGVLDGCLLNDGEWARWEEVMVSDEDVARKERMLAGLFEDGFEDWDDDDEEEEGGHNGHSHGHNHDHTHKSLRS